MDKVSAECGALGEAAILLGYFKDLLDPRQRGEVMYPLEEVLLSCPHAVLAGAETIVDIGALVRKTRALRASVPTGLANWSILSQWARFSASSVLHLPLAIKQLDLADPAPPLAAAHLDDEIDCVDDVVSSVGPIQVDTGKQRHHHDLVDRAGRTVGMNRGDRTGMAGIDRAQEGECLGPTQLAEQDAIRPKAQRALQQMFLRNLSFAHDAPHRDQRNAIGMADA